MRLGAVSFFVFFTIFSSSLHAQSWLENYFTKEDFLNDLYSQVKSSCAGKMVWHGVDPYGPGFYEETPAPSYVCSGLIIRGTRQERPDGQNAWDPYPEGRIKDTSFSYLRADIKMQRLANGYSNGFIINPPTELSVNCFYPLDAVSDKRTDNGCGVYEGDSGGNPECPDNVVLTDEVPIGRRCRYDLRTEAAASQFRKGVTVAVRVSLNSEVPNDLKIQTWKKGCDPRLSIRAFFYVNDQGKPFAERDRKQYEEICNKRVDLVYMKFPETKGGLITFKIID